MIQSLRLFVAATVVATAALAGGAARALACGNSTGYSYAGVGASSPAYGIAATITPLDAFDVVNGHVAGWVGVGGPGEGPNGTNEWLQIGYSGYPSLTGSDIYYEVAMPRRVPSYHQIAAALPVGTVARVAVLEIRNRPNWWRVWLNHRPVSRPIRLPQSHGRWSPIATAESWDGGTGGTCNTFLYSFRRVSLAHAAGGGWRQLTGGFAIRSAATRVERHRGAAAFFAAEGRPAFRLLAATS
ncbi:MAG TPA: hypothetical protein VH541_00250 [Gaiellaceae bacterium]|jgi:hypothetical protein